MNHSKYLFTSIVVAFLLVFSNCDRLENLILIPIDINSSFDVPADSELNALLTITSDSVNTNIEEALLAKDSEVDKVTTVELNELELSIDTTGKDFSFADTIEVYVSATGLGERLIANKQGVDSSATTVLMDIITSDLSAYILQDQISFTAKFKKLVTDTTVTSINIVSSFIVNSEIF